MGWCGWEQHVVQATGPCALTAALACFDYSRINMPLPAPRADGRMRGLGDTGGAAVGRREARGGTRQAHGCGEQEVLGAEAGGHGCEAWSGEESVAQQEQQEQEGAGDADIFSRSEMQELVARIRARLVAGGYRLDTPPSAAEAHGVSAWYRQARAQAEGSGRKVADGGGDTGEGFVGEQGDGGVAAGRYGPAAMFIYPPEAFYVMHWREDRAAALGRSASRCFGIHSWDTTWAPHALAPPAAYSCYLGPLPLRPLPPLPRRLLLPSRCSSCPKPGSAATAA